LAISSSSYAGSKVSTYTGGEYTVKADNTSIISILSVLQRIKQTSDLAVKFVPYADSADEQYKTSEMVSKISGVLNLSLTDLNNAVTYGNSIKDLLNASALLPHRNVVTLEATSSGGVQMMKSRSISALTLTAVCSYIGNLLNVGTSTGSVIKNAGDMRKSDDYDQSLNDSQKKLDRYQADLTNEQGKLDALDADLQAKKSAYADAVSKGAPQAELDQLESRRDAAQKAYNAQLNAISAVKSKISAETQNYNDYLALQTSSKARTLKRLSVAAAIGSEATEILQQILASIISVMNMNSKLGQPQGVLIKSADYVNIKSGLYATLSGDGPVVIESADTPIGDMLRLGVFDALHPVGVLKPELAYQSPSYSYKERTKGLILASSLVRALAQEISLVADHSIVAKADEQIQILAGVPPADAPLKAAATAARQAANKNFNAIEAAPEAEKDGLRVSRYQQTLEYLNLPHRVKAVTDFGSGILLKTQSAASPICLQTVERNSAIDIVQGDPTSPGPGQSRRISLSPDDLTIQDNQNVKLHLKGEPAEVTLQASDSVSVKMTPQSVSMRSSSDVGVDLSATAIALKSTSSIKLTVGGNSLEVSPQGIKGASGGVSFDLKPVVINLG
jgi:hypothetical protein